MSWYLLLAGEARAGLKRPVTLVGFAMSLLMGLVWGLIASGPLGKGAASLATSTVLALASGVPTVGVLVAILVGAGFGGEDHDLGTKRDLYLAGINPVQHLICKLVAAVDFAVALALLLPVGGVFAGLIGVVFRGAAFWGESVPGQHAAIWAGLGELVILIPLVAVGAVCMASLLRSRLLGVVVWFVIYLLYLTSGVWLARYKPLAGIVNFTPIGSAIALVEGKGWSGAAAMQPWVALAVMLVWFVLLVTGAVWRERASEAWAQRRQERRAQRRSLLGRWRPLDMGRFAAERPIRWGRHLLAVGCLVVLIGVGGWAGADDLIRVGANFDSIHQVLTHNLRRDYLEHLMELLSRGDFQAAGELVGPAGKEGLALIESQLGNGSDTRLGWGVDSYGKGGSRAFIYVDRTVVREGETTIVSSSFVVDLDFREGRWHCLGISRSR